MEDERQTLQEGDLLAYVEGVAPADVARRIEQSPELLAEAANLQAMDALLYTALDPFDALTTDDLLLYQAGLLNPEEKQQIEQQLAAHPEMQEMLNALALPPEDPTPSAGSALHERLRQTGRQILEALRLPAPQQPALAVRGGEQRNYVYQAGGYQIILALTPPVLHENIRQLEGQIIAEDEQQIPANAAVHMLRDGMPVAGDAVDEFGFFAFDRLGPGSYTIQIDLAATSIVIDHVPVE